MLESIIFFFVFIPIYILFVYIIRNPKKMATLKLKWRYECKVQPSKYYIKYIKISAIIGIMALTLVLLSYFTNRSK